MSTITNLSTAVRNYKETPSEEKKQNLVRIAQDFARKLGGNKEHVNRLLQRNKIEVQI